MATDGPRSRLGRGLASLIGDAADTDASTKPERTQGARRVPIEFLRPNPRNPRRNFPEAELEELTTSIKERGVIQPILVRAVRGSSEHYEIIAGERRWRAAQRAGVHDIPVLVIEASDSQALEIAIIENVQRAGLNALEEAAGYQSLVDEFAYSQDDVAKTVGKSRSHVANTLRLLKLPESVKAHIHAGRLSAGHARMLIGLDNAAELAQDIIERDLNVRQVEALAQQRAGRDGKSPARRARASAGKDADMLALEKRVSDALGLSVSIDHRGESGVLHVHYRSLDQLEDVLRRLERAE
ncbi:MAG: ParB/RepB/Spo0J family partition protein [Rhodoplanes sp.]